MQKYNLTSCRVCRQKSVRCLIFYTGFTPGAACAIEREEEPDTCSVPRAAACCSVRAPLGPAKQIIPFSREHSLQVAAHAWHLPVTLASPAHGGQRPAARTMPSRRPRHSVAHVDQRRACMRRRMSARRGRSDSEHELAKLESRARGLVVATPDEHPRLELRLEMDGERHGDGRRGHGRGHRRRSFLGSWGEA